MTVDNEWLCIVFAQQEVPLLCLLSVLICAVKPETRSQFPASLLSCYSDVQARLWPTCSYRCCLTETTIKVNGTGNTRWLWWSPPHCSPESLRVYSVFIMSLLMVAFNKIFIGFSVYKQILWDRVHLRLEIDLRQALISQALCNQRSKQTFNLWGWNWRTCMFRAESVNNLINKKSIKNSLNKYRCRQY